MSTPETLIDAALFLGMHSREDRIRTAAKNSPRWAAPPSPDFPSPTPCCRPPPSVTAVRRTRPRLGWPPSTADG